MCVLLFCFVLVFVHPSSLRERECSIVLYYYHVLRNQYCNAHVQMNEWACGKNACRQQTEISLNPRRSPQLSELLGQDVFDAFFGAELEAPADLPVPAVDNADGTGGGASLAELGGADTEVYRLLRLAYDAENKRGSGSSTEGQHSKEDAV